MISLSRRILMELDWFGSYVNNKKQAANINCKHQLRFQICRMYCPSRPNIGTTSIHRQGVANGGGQGGQTAPPDTKNRKGEQKSGRGKRGKGKKKEGKEEKREGRREREKEREKEKGKKKRKRKGKEKRREERGKGKKRGRGKGGRKGREKKENAERGIFEHF